jgi:mannose-6-phosphate isomerase-like protein (cupin superfamily)
MNLARVVGLTPVVCLAASLTASAQSPVPTNAAPAHRMIAAEEIVWVAGPAALPPGDKMAVLSGDPGQPGPFTLRAQLPAGYRIPAHWHPTDEHVTVLSGTVAMGTGEKFDESALRELKAGGFVHMPATTRHFLLSKTDSVVQVHGTGPFALTYVNPADDPRNAAPKATKD